MTKAYKTKTLKTLPKCDLCGSEAKYDAPMWTGTWAYMCEDCAKRRGAKINLGTEFILRMDIPQTSEEARVAKIVKASLDEITVLCPNCGDLFALEPDADSGCCQLCGQMVKVCNPLC